jgi:integrase
MATGKLTALAVDRAHREGQPVMLCDGGGLYFRKQTRDGAAWTLRYRFAGRARWMTLGNYPDMNLADARVEAREKRAMLDRQRDPLLEKWAVVEQQRAAIVAQKARGTFRELAEDWYDTEIEGQRLKHPQVPRRHLDNYLLPEFGDRVPAEITPADAARLLAKVSKRAPTAANDLLRFMRRVFRFGVRQHLLTSNPVADFDQQDAGGPERKRRRALSRGELEDLFKALREAPSFGGENFLAIKLLLALGVRKGELLKATWDEFDFEGRPDTGPVWRLPGNRTKTGEPLTIPLVPEVIEWLQALRLVAAGGIYVFPKRRRDPRNRSLHVGIDTLNAALASVEHGVPHFTLHDLRRTMRTHLAALGVRSEVAERCLGHKLRGVERVYNTHDYLNERRLALEKWTAVLLAIESGERKVTPMRRQVAG